MKYLLLLCLLGGTNLTSVQAQAWIADSLIQKLETAEPGYDQIDYCLGITRGYMIAREAKGFKKYLDKAWEFSELQNDLAGMSQAKVFYHLLERNMGGSMDKAASYAKEAYEYGLASEEMDALTFAVYQYAEVLGTYQKKNESAIQLIEEHLTRLDPTVTLKNRANFYKSYGHALARNGDDQQAIAYYTRALEILESIMTNPDLHHRLDRVSALYADKGIVNTSITKNDLAKAYARTGNLKQAIQISVENLDLVTQHNIPDYIAWISSNLGNLYKQKGDYATAIQFFQDATRIWEKDPSAGKDIALLKIPLGEIHNEMQDYDIAIKHFQFAIDYAMEHQDTSDYLEALILKVECLAKKGRTKEAIDEFENMETVASQFGAQEILAEVKLKKAATFQILGQYQDAITDLQSANDIFEKMGNQSRFPEVDIRMADNYRLSGNDQLAIEKLNRGINLSKEYGQDNQLSRGYELLSTIYKKKGNYKSALDNFELFHNNEHNLLANNAQKILREEQVRQNVNQFKEEKEIATERAALLQTQNKLYIGLAASLVGFLLIGSYLYNQVRKSRGIIQKRNEELADLNATKDKFFSIIGHDIRSPLVALGGVGEQMEYYVEKGKTDKMKRLSSKIGRTANHLSSLLDNLLNWALIQRGTLPHKPVQFSLYQLVSESIDMFTMNAELKDIQLINEIEKDIMVKADVTAVNTIVRNLLSNALKFTPQGGRILLTSDIIEHNACLRVQDNGIGMDAKKTQNIFNLNPNRDTGTDGEKGTGLGLMLCKELVELNQGTISVSSEVDNGTTFSIELPKAA